MPKIIQKLPQNSKIHFWTSFDGGVFWSETLIVDLGRLMMFLTKWRLDLDSLG